MRVKTHLYSLAILFGGFFGQSASAVELEGQFVQGGLILGSSEPGTTVTLDGKAMLVDELGRFVFGFDRDHAASATLAITMPNGEVETKDLQIASREYDISRVDGIPKKYIEPAPETLVRIKKETAIKNTARRDVTSSDGFVETFEWPLTGRISGVYGSQRYYNGTPGRPHYGVDIAAPTGTYFRAPAPGIVTLAEGDMYYEGGLIFLDHGMGLISAFLHLSGVDVEVGQAVQKGDILGRVGAAGRANGPHLDWRMYWTNQRVDPTLLVPAMSDVLEAKVSVESDQTETKTQIGDGQ